MASFYLAAPLTTSGFWHGVEAAFKFVPVKAQRHYADEEDALANSAISLTEMTTMKAVSDPCILEILGHYR